MFHEIYFQLYLHTIHIVYVTTFNCFLRDYYFELFQSSQIFYHGIGFIFDVWSFVSNELLMVLWTL